MYKKIKLDTKVSCQKERKTLDVCYMIVGVLVLLLTEYSSTT